MTRWRKLAYKRRISSIGSGKLKGNVVIVTQKDHAYEIMQKLMSKRATEGWIHAADTEVSGFDTERSPIGNGKVICASIYSGPNADYGIIICFNFLPHPT